MRYGISNVIQLLVECNYTKSKIIPLFSSSLFNTILLQACDNKILGGYEMKIGANISEFRKAMKLTQEQLSNSFGVSVAAVSKWETGVAYPDIDK